MPLSAILRIGLLTGFGFLLTWLPPAGLFAEEILLGMSGAFKGPSRGLSIELYRGSLAYFQHINKEGGVHGRPKGLPG